MPASRAEDPHAPVSRPGSIVLLLCLPCVLYAGGFSILRKYGEIPLLVTLVLAVAAILLHGRVNFKRSYLLFFGFSAVILALSFLSVMPKAWTVMHDNFAAVRHWIWVPALPVIGSAFALVCRRSFDHIERHALKYLLLVYIFTRLSRTFSGDIYVEEQAWLIYTFTSDNMVVALTFLLFLFRADRNAILDCSYIVLALALSTSSQSLLFFLWLLALRVVGRARLLTLALILFTMLFILVAPLFVVAIDNIDPNSGVRAVLWRDTWIALLETYGLGVGFGTEYITNNFYEIRGSREWSMVVSQSDLIYVATHSTFYDVALRTGIVGLGLFLFWFRSAVRLIVVLEQRRERFYSAIVGLLVINCSINVGLSSIQFLFGSAFCVGLLGHLRQRFGRTSGSSERHAPRQTLAVNWSSQGSRTASFL